MNNDLITYHNCLNAVDLCFVYDFKQHQKQIVMSINVYEINRLQCTVYKMCELCFEKV